MTLPHDSVRRYARLVTVASAVIAGTSDVSLRTVSQSPLKVSVSRWAMLWEMSAVKACVRCVGVLALALGLMLRFMPHKAAGMYRNWRKRRSKLTLCPILFSHLSFYYSFFISLLMLSYCAVSLSPLQAGLFGQKQKTDVSLYVE